MQAVFVCGGRGTRLMPRRAGPKSLVEVGGSTLFARLAARIAPLHTSRLRPIVIVDAADRETPGAVRDVLPHARVIAQPRPDGVASAMLLAAEHLDERALVVLGDVFIDGRFDPAIDGAAVAWWTNAPDAETRKNFGIVAEGGEVTRVVEKPADCSGLRCGMGVYVLTPAVVDRFRETPIDPPTGERGITAALQTAIDRGLTLRTLPFVGYYNNVNTPRDVVAVDDYLAAAAVRA